MCAACRYLEQGVDLQWLLDNPEQGPSEEQRMQAQEKVRAACTISALRSI